MHVLTPDSPPATPVELTSALHAAGTLRQGAIRTVTITERIETIVSNLWFLEVDYTAGSSPKLPNRLVLKWPLEQSPAPERGTPELVFYRELAPALPSPPMVSCLATASPAGKHQWLILEDLRSSHSPPGPTSAALHDAVAVLAQLHARWWEAPTLGSTVGNLHTETSLRTMVYGISANLPGLLDDVRDDLPLSDRLVLETVFDSSLQPWLRLVDRRALTVIHGDAHTGNFLFPRSGHGESYLIDWQLWHLDVGPRDVAFLIGLRLEPGVRQQLERPLLRTYYEKLISGGVVNYSFADLLLDYRRCVVRNLTFPLILWARGAPRDDWRYCLNSALAAYRDLNCAELL